MELFWVENIKGCQILETSPVLQKLKMHILIYAAYKRSAKTKSLTLEGRVPCLSWIHTKS